MKKNSNLEVKCSCCEAILTVDRTTGEVLFTQKPPAKASLSFEDAISRVQREKDQAEQRFQDAFAKEKDRKRLVEQKFEELMKRKDDLDTPVRDIDLD